jgi:predicted dehydrogenase
MATASSAAEWISMNVLAGTVRALPMTAVLLAVGIMLLAVTVAPAKAQPPATQPGSRLRLGLVGLVHGHVYGFLYAVCDRRDVELVGVAEPEQNLLDRYGTRHKLPAAILFRDLDEMLDKARPEAVAIFTDTFDHLNVVEACARRGIHVMMEKPLAVSLPHALAMERAAREGKIHVLVNFETTWYPNTQAAFEVVTRQGRLGKIRKIVCRDGHKGPKEIGMPREFLSFLTDPARNGAGALYDFGCYGANLMTWLMGEQRPRSVTAVTQRFKSDPAYQRVDDEATIILTYPDAQGIIQASWNWPYNRKDMEIYGDRGYYLTIDSDSYRLRTGDAAETQVRAEPVAATANDSISYLIAVAKGKIAPSGPSSLKVNVIASEILDAARRSAETGRTVRLDPQPPGER